MSVMGAEENATVSTEAAVRALARRSIQREAGDGASGHQESYIDQHTPQENDGRSKTVTGFDSSNPVDASGRPVNNPQVRRNGRTYRKWDYLNQLNDGVQDKDRAAANWEAGKINDAKLFAGHLEFNREQTELLIEMSTTINFDEFGQYDTSQVLVGCCSLVADRATDNFEDRIVVTDEFKELMEVANLGSREHRKIRQGIRDRTEFF